jgi:hypothetical protein
MAMCRRGVLDCILWVRFGRNDGCFSDFISVIFPAGIFRVSLVQHHDQAVLTKTQESNIMDHLVSHLSLRRVKADQKDPSLFHIRSSMFHGIAL